MLGDELVLGDSEALGEVEADGDNEELAEPEGEVEALGEVEELGLAEELGETLAEGLSEALGEVIAPARRATTEEPAVTGFHIHTKRIRPEVRVLELTVMVMSQVIVSRGKFVVLLAIKTAWGLVPVQISEVFSWEPVVEAIKQAVESEPPPA